MAALQPWLDGNYKYVWNEKVLGFAFVEGEDVTLEGPTVHKDHVEKSLEEWQL